MTTPSIILTGSSRGIGLACLDQLLKQTTTTPNVIALSRTTTKELLDLKESHPNNLRLLQGDVANDNDNKRAVEEAIKSFGAIHALILNAGTINFERLESSSMDSWKHLFDVNFFSLVSIVKHALPHLRASNGRIIFVSSGAALGGIPAWGSYNASKAAMNSFCRTLANEEPGITTIAVRPGVVDTEMQGRLRAEAKEVMDPPNFKRFHGLHQDGKLVNPLHPARVLAHLALNAPAPLSGQFLSWDADELAAYR